MAKLKSKVVGLGQCSLDVLGRLPSYPEVDQKAELEETLIQGGGPVATALVTLARLGVDTSFWGRVGADFFGEQIRQGMVSEGVDCRGLLTDPQGTSQFAFISVERGSGHRNIFWTRGSARPLESAEFPSDTLEGCSILLLDGLHLGVSVHAAGLARKRGLVTVLDGGTLRPGTEQLLPLIDHLVVSERFARQFISGNELGTALVPLLQYGAQAVTVTAGAGGSYTLERGGRPFHQPAFCCPVVDTTGCGDVFHGSYIYGLLQNWPLKRTVEFAAACAALKTRALGGRTAIPSLPEVEAFLSKRV